MESRLNNNRPCRHFRGFTLIELLVVVSIIALLVSILMPALERARKQARQVVCMARLRSLSQAAMLYAIDNEDKLPLVGQRNHRGNLYNNAYPYAPYWDMHLLTYLGAANVDLSLGENTTEDGGKKEYLGPHEGVLENFICPSSRSNEPDRVEMVESRDFYYRSYRINAFLAGRVTDRDGTFDPKESYRDSFRLANIKQTSRTLLFTESRFGWGVNTVWGDSIVGWWNIHPAHFVTAGGETDPPNAWLFPEMWGRTNFCFADGSVKSLETQFTEAHYEAGPGFRDYPDPLLEVKLHPIYSW